MSRWSRTHTVTLTLVAALALIIALGVGVPRLLGGGSGAAAPMALRPPHGSEQFYFVMTDRFANGDPSNDGGGLTGARELTGFDPSDPGFYHGGDLKGLTGKLDYIKGLGTTAIWLTPSFKNRVVQGSGGDASAGYHGYWITDFTQIDPHLGTNQDMAALIEAAHAKGMRVYFDIITNHTADVISPADGNANYVTKAERPYLDDSGTPFDDADYVGKDAFPATNTSTFPHPPQIAPELAGVKQPAWLNDPTMYHNRGDTTWSGESETYGDFVGLDDLWTERPEVVKGMIDIYQAWIDLGIDGFRIDTVKHVNLGFWQQFWPAIHEYAVSKGKPDFFAFGEVYTAQASVRAGYSKEGRLPTTLDFGFQEKARDFALGQSADGLKALFDSDDEFTDGDSNASFQPTFLGNHDMGRIGMFLSASAAGTELVARDQLAHSLMFLTRGQPVIYYGDEQGFVGEAGDKEARQDMFATRVESWRDQPVIGAEPGARERFDPNHPLYRHIASLAALRAANPALVSGSMVQRHADGSVFAVSRVDRDTGTEYLVAFNNSGQDVSVALPTATPETSFAAIFGTSGALASDPTGSVNAIVPALGAVVWKAAKPIPAANSAVTLGVPAGSSLNRQPTLTADVGSPVPAAVTFQVKTSGASSWTDLGTDDNPPYSVTADLRGLPAGPVEVRAEARDATGRTTAATVPVTLP